MTVEGLCPGPDGKGHGAESWAMFCPICKGTGVMDEGDDE